MSHAKRSSFVVYHEKGTDGASVELEIRKQKDVDVERAATMADVLNRMSAGSTAALICNVNRVDQAFVNFIRRVHTLDSASVIIAMSAINDEKAFAQMKTIPRVIPLESPAHPQTIKLLCEKIVEGRDVKQRRHTRFMTDQPGVLEDLESGKKMNVHVFNISQGGAYIECAAGSAIKVKDVVKVTIKLDKLGKIREVHAKVTWLSSFSAAKGVLGAGLEFVNADDAYMALLEND